MRTLTIPTLEPGEKWLCDSLDLSHTLTIRRPNGDPVLELQF